MYARAIPQGKLINQYLKKKNIGEGPYSKIKLMVDIQTQKPYAMKKYNMFVLGKKINMGKKSAQFGNKLAYTTYADEVRREVKVWRELNHPRIANLHEIIEDEEEQKLYLFMDFCEHGDIAKWNSKKQTFQHNWSAKQLIQYFTEAAQGLAYLHGENVVHRDVKPLNILLTSDKHVKLIDFGRSVKLSSPNEKLNGSEGTYEFMAPEMLSEKFEGGYNGKQCDIWSLGVSFFGILFGYLPFRHELLIKLFDIIQKGQYSLPNPIKQEYEPFVPLLRQMMNVNPLQRPTAQGLVQRLKMM